jgi:transcriptional regulator with XRE-family HTH domain
MTITSNERRIAGANIRRLRLDFGLSLTKLAEELEIERTYFHDIENGTANATFEKYERIAAHFGKTVRDLLTERKRERREMVRR